MLASICALACAIGCSLTVNAQGTVTATLDRIGGRVEEFYRQARRILATETVVVQPLQSDRTPAGFPERLVYESRMEWDGEESDKREARIVRTLLRIDGRLPRRTDDDAGCVEREDALALVLTPARHDFIFSLGKPAKFNGRQAMTIDFKGRGTKNTRPVPASWKRDCVTVALDERLQGRLRIDPETHDVLQLERRLAGQVDFLGPDDLRLSPGPLWRTLERWEQTVTYKPVEFHGPDETLIVPASVETLAILRGAGISRVRTTQTFSGYRRFVAESRIVDDDAR